MNKRRCYIIGSGYLASLFREACLCNGIAPILVTDRLLRGADCGWEVIGSAEFLRRLAPGSDPSELVVNASGPGTAAIGQVEADGWLCRQRALLEQMSSTGLPPRMVLVSSGGTVYGDHGTQPIGEDAALLGATPYAGYQIAIESRYREIFGPALTVLRVGNPYGTHQFGKTGQGFVMALIRNLLADQVTIVFGRGALIRDYLYEEDLYSLVPMLFAAESAGTFNIASGVGHSQNAVTEAIAEVYGRMPRLVLTDSRPTDIACNVLSTEAAHKSLGWRAVTDLKPGLARMRQKLLELV